MMEHEWKPWRTVFNPSFSASVITNQVPQIIEEVQVYVSLLRAKARSKQMFFLDDMTLALTMDIIGRVTLGSRLRSQTRKNVLASAMRSQIEWLTFGNEMNPWYRWHPMRPFIQWYNGRQMDRFIDRELDRCFKKIRAGPDAETTVDQSVMSVALESFIQENQSKEMDSTFRQYARAQTRLFLFAGHDTTSSTICYCFHLLSNHPQALAKMREEHDQAFGTDLEAAPGVLSANPDLINRLPYTLAVIKETLRLFPPASSMREGVGASGTTITDRGRAYPVDGFYVWVLHLALQRSPRHWPRPDAFLPARWLVGPGDPLHPAQGAWRPFEFGPRNCIGQTLVLADVKTVLVLAGREFDVAPAYDEWDAQRPRRGPKTVRGERAYQIERGGAHPADGYPCRVSFASGAR